MEEIMLLQHLERGLYDFIGRYESIEDAEAALIKLMAGYIVKNHNADRSYILFRMGGTFPDRVIIQEITLSIEKTDL